MNEIDVEVFIVVLFELFYLKFQRLILSDWLNNRLEFIHQIIDVLGGGALKPGEALHEGAGLGTVPQLELARVGPQKVAAALVVDLEVRSRHLAPHLTRYKRRGV